MIHHSHPMVIESRDPGEPTVVTKSWTQVGCGCRVYAGLRTDTREVTTVAVDCGEEGHNDMMVEFNERMKASLKEPRDEPAINVCDEILTALYEEQGDA